MYFRSKTISLLILAVTAMTASRVMFWLFNDPEGPNLLIVTVMSAIVYFLSLAAYYFLPSPPSLTGLKRLLFVILVQVLIVAVCYFSLS